LKHIALAPLEAAIFLKFRYAACLMLFAAGCWINGVKLQDNEVKKKVRSATVRLALLSFCLVCC
jgi:hypothetical protein